MGKYPGSLSTFVCCDPRHLFVALVIRHLCPGSHLLLPEGRPCFAALASTTLRFMQPLQSEISGKGRKKKESTIRRGVAVAPAGGTPDSHAPLTYLTG